MVATGAAVHRKVHAIGTAFWRVCVAGCGALAMATAGFGQAKPATPVLLRRLAPSSPSPARPAPALSSIDLIVPEGTPLRVSLIRKVPIRKVGDPVTARVIEPVYAFDRVVVPKGSEVTGKVIKIIPATKLVRTEAILNGNFTPLKTAKVEFDTLILKNGTRMALDTDVLPGTSNVIRLVTGRNDKKPNLVDQAKEAIDQQWRSAIDQVKQPGKLHRLKQLALSELPYHRQYLHAGTVFDAELTAPLDFGPAALRPAEVADMGQVPPQNSEVEARLLTPLNSATAVKGAAVSAVVTRPLFSAKHKERLLLPEGTRLEGDVVQVRPARRLDRTGQLRFVIRKMELPSGSWDRVDASVAGLEVGRGANLKLDSEGGASVTKSKKRFLTTALSLAVAATTVAGDSDHHLGSSPGNIAGGDAGRSGLGGASGYRLVGLALGLGVHSQILGSVLGFYGAARSVYFHFLARGRNVVLAKDTPMEITFGPRLGPASR
jgi:hypothetical protein